MQKRIEQKILKWGDDKNGVEEGRMVDDMVVEKCVNAKKNQYSCLKSMVYPNPDANV